MGKAHLTCEYCGRDVEPCLNCGDSHGKMVKAYGSGWMHEDKNHCILHLRERITELETQRTAAPQAADSGKDGE